LNITKKEIDAIGKGKKDESIFQCYYISNLLVLSIWGIDDIEIKGVTPLELALPITARI